MYLGSNVDFLDSLELYAEKWLHVGGVYPWPVPLPFPILASCPLFAAHPHSARALVYTRVGILSHCPGSVSRNTDPLATCQVQGVPPVMWFAFRKVPVYALEVGVGLNINGDNHALGPENSLPDGDGCGWSRGPKSVGHV